MREFTIDANELESISQFDHSDCDIESVTVEYGRCEETNDPIVNMISIVDKSNIATASNIEELLMLESKDLAIFDKKNPKNYMMEDFIKELAEIIEMDEESMKGQCEEENAAWGNE